MVVGRRLVNLVAEHKKTAITTIIGFIAGPIIGYLLIESITITPTDLVRDLENGQVSKFNEDRKQIKQQIVFDGIDLSGKNLTKANLNSLVILHSNLSNTNLQNSSLENVQISGDLSEIDLTDAILANADLTDAYLPNADLTDAIFHGANLRNAILGFADLTNALVLNSNLIDADLSLANLNGAIFDCSSLRTVNLAVVNVTQIHIVDSNISTTNLARLNEVSNCNSLTTIYQSNADGFRIGVYDGWVIEDYDNTLVQSQDQERQRGFTPLAMICPREQALLSMNRTYACPEEASPALLIIRFSELQTRPEFAGAIQENGTITITDFLEFVTQLVENLSGFKNIQTVDTKDLTVNATDPQTNQTLATESGKQVLYTFTLTDPSSGRDFELLETHAAVVLSNYTNTGYLFLVSLTPASVMGNLSHGEMGRQMDQMLHSFELLATANATTTTTTAPDGS
jgi:uncharacterized protein YjbI with pentapeptide repeats